MHHHTYQVTWSGEHDRWLATCPQLPGLSYLDSNRTAALHGIVELVEFAADDLDTLGREADELGGSLIDTQRQEGPGCAEYRSDRTTLRAVPDRM